MNKNMAEKDLNLSISSFLRIDNLHSLEQNKSNK